LLTVTTAATTCNLLLDGIDGDRNYTANYTANFTVYTNVSGLTVKIDSNYTGWVLQSGVSPFENRTKLIHQGTNVNVTGYYEASANYTACSETHYFNIFNITFNVTLPSWKISPTDDSYITSLGPCGDDPYYYCSVSPYICRNTSQWNSTSLNAGMYGKYYNEWAWLKFQRSILNWCNYAEMCMYKSGDTGLTSAGDWFYLYYSHNQTWNEIELTWDDKPAWIDSWIERVNITDADGWICWDITNEFCSNVDSNTTYMLRNMGSELYTESRHLNFTVGDAGMGSRAWDLFVDSQNTTYTFNTTEINSMKNETYEDRSYIRVVPNYIGFPGSVVNNATLMVYVPAMCNQTIDVTLYECMEQNMTEQMIWNNQPYCSNSGMNSNWALPGWKTFNVTDIVQRAAMSGGYQTSNISIMLGINTSYSNSNTSLTTFINGSANEYNFTGSGNATYYLKIPKYSNVTSAYFNISGKQTWTDKWNYSLPTPTIHHVLVTQGGSAASTATKTCSDTEAGAEFTHEYNAPSVGGVLLWDTTTWNTSSYNWTTVYGNYTAKGGISGGGGIVSTSIKTGTSCSPIADACEGITSLVPECNSLNTETDTTPSGNYGIITLSKISPTKSGVVSIISNGGTAAGSSVNAYVKWESGSYFYIEMQNYTYPYPNGTAIDIGAVNGWDWQQPYNNLTTSNRTGNWNTVINSYLADCEADADGFCLVPVKIHSETPGTIRLDTVEVNYTSIACWASEEYSGTTYDPRIEIGYTYKTKDRIANFRSNNYTDNATQRPYLSANISWELNTSSATGNSTLGYTYTPKGQMSSQWIYKVCSASNFGEPPMDVYLNLTSITNSTGSSLTALPSCVTSFWHYSNSTNVASASEQNITGNTAKKVLNNLTSGTCGYIWENITLKNCTAGDYWNFNWTWTACDVGGC